jgi:uncharacterized protein
MEKDLQKVRSAKKQVDQLYRKLEKAGKPAVNQLFHPRHEAVFKEINCLDCAKCCKHTGPLFTASDMKRLAAHFKLSVPAFQSQFLRVDEEGDWVLQSVPCPFLGENNACSVYDIRPKACREYPHTDHPDMRSILKLTRKNADICPAVARITLQLLQIPELNAKLQK